jgi:hypothetical protein
MTFPETRKILQQPNPKTKLARHNITSIRPTIRNQTREADYFVGAIVSV